MEERGVGGLKQKRNYINSGQLAAENLLRSDVLTSSSDAGFIRF